MSDLGWTEYARREEEAMMGRCFENAIKNGRTIEEAEDCDSSRPLCSDCPFLKETK